MPRSKSAVAEEPAVAAAEEVADEVLGFLNGNKTVDADESDLPPEFLDIGLSEEGDGGAPTSQFHIPTDEDFKLQKEKEYIFDAGLRDAAEGMINSLEFPELVHLQDLRMVFAWKYRGGTEKGVPNKGGVKRGDSLLRSLGDTDFVVWLGADTCRDVLITERDRNAALYHELCKCSVDEFGKPFVQGPDLKMFNTEVAHFGLWSTKLKRAAREMVPVYEQAGLEL